MSSLPPAPSSLARSSAPAAGHKRNYIGYIHPQRTPVADDVFDEALESVEFELFLQERLDNIPDDKEPADAYAYNSHMGAFLRALDQAKDEYSKAVRAYYAARNTRTM